MKKCLLSLLLIVAVLGCFLKAEDVKVKTDRPAFFFNLGAITAVSGEYIFPLPCGGFSLDYPLAKNVMISPELNVVFYNYMPVFFAPGVQINFKDDSKFVGGGIIVLTDFHDHYSSGNSAMLWKFNAGGYIGDGTKISVYLLAGKNISVGILLGASVSFRLGSKK
ncbi:MAG: hypothetical protein NT166_10840 [Candidatus Aminicenantes bacterium]|nr:hypothetical protein [Candidatus Aminicenantes bacterium]